MALPQRAPELLLRLLHTHPTIAWMVQPELEEVMDIKGVTRAPLPPQPQRGFDGPIVHQCFHGTMYDKIPGILSAGRVCCISEEEGGSGIGVYTRAYQGAQNNESDLRCVLNIWKSSKTPQGFVFQGTARTFVKGFWQGGHDTEMKLVRPGCAAHNKRAKSYTFDEGDCSWKYLLHVAGWSQEELEEMQEENQ